MEGGYHKFNGKLALCTINALSGQPNPFPKDVKGPLMDISKREKTRKKTQELVNSMRDTLGHYFYGI